MADDEIINSEEDAKAVLSGTMGGGKNLRYPEKVVIKDGEKVRIVAQPVIVERHDDHCIHHAELQLDKFERAGSKHAWPTEPKRITLVGEEINLLGEVVRSIKALSGTEVGEEYVVFSTKKGLAGIGAAAADALLNLLRAAAAEGSLDTIVRLAAMEAAVLDNLGAAVRHRLYKQQLQKFAELVDNDCSEKDLENWIRQNPWVFGVEYLETEKTKRISLHCEIDLLMATLDDYYDVIETKKAGLPLLSFDSSHKTFYPSGALSQAIGQVVNYVQKMEDYRLQLNEEEGIYVLKPRARIVIGRSEDWDDAQRNALRKINAELTNIEIMTYDQLIQRGRQLIKLYSELTRRGSCGSAEDGQA